MLISLEKINIKSIITYLPEEILEMKSLASVFGEKEVVTIIRTTGVERVHIAAPDETASDMCYYAAQQLIENEAMDRSLIDGLVFVSQSPDYRLPATSVVLQHRLGLSNDTVCFDISYGCSAYIYGLFQASLLLSTKACKNVLVLTGDTTTKMINPRDRSQRMVFGDAGAATLVSQGNDSISFHIGSDGSGFDQAIIPAGGFRKPSSDETKKEFIDKEGNVRSEENLYMDGISVFNFIVHNGKQSILTLLDFLNWTKEEVDLFALHQGTSFSVRYLLKRLGLKEDKAPINIINYGNTGPATIPLVLSDRFGAKKDKTDNPLKKIIMSAYGVGLSWGSVACDLSSTKIYSPIQRKYKEER